MTPALSGTLPRSLVSRCLHKCYPLVSTQFYKSLSMYLLSHSHSLYRLFNWLDWIYLSLLLLANLSWCFTYNWFSRIALQMTLLHTFFYCISTLLFYSFNNIIRWWSCVVLYCMHMCMLLYPLAPQVLARSSHYFPSIMMCMHISICIYAMHKNNIMCMLLFPLLYKYWLDVQ